KPELNELKSPLNQHQFNYKSYLVKQGIHHQIFVTKNEFISIVNSDVSLFGLSTKFRERVKESLQKYHFSKNEFGVINALLLGQRQDISKELINDYANAGAIHILAVSGLHIGIILLILSSILKPLDSIKYGKFIKLLLIVMLLWVFAFIAGLSASVVRAVTMFTFVAFGMISNRKSNIYYSLITSMFYLLLIKPMFLFDVGFQLSYLAVFGIVWIQPMLSSLWIPKYKLINKIWQLLTVSVAAQLIILPVSLYYFHQFPSLFLLSNLVIIPFLGIILMLGILVIVLAVINLLPQILADFYGTVINMMNQFVSWVASQEGFLLIDISVSKLVMISLYIAIFSGVYFFNKRTSKGLLMFLVSLTLIQSTFIYEKYIRNSKHELIIFHKSRTSIIGERNAGKLLVSSELDTVEIRNLKLLKSYKIGEDIDLTFKNKIQDVFYTNKNQLLVIDSLGVYQNLNINQPIVLLRHSPKINLKRMINELNPKQIIADGNNYKSYINNWREICEKEKIPFHYTGKNGTYIIK
ncbi:MAG: ComEC/Rec2 family competence protein, partial [Flavobacteriaceae bacterium]